MCNGFATPCSTRKQWLSNRYTKTIVIVFLLVGTATIISKIVTSKAISFILPATPQVQYPGEQEEFTAVFSHQKRNELSLYKFYGCPAYDRWRFSSNAPKLDGDAAITRSFFSNHSETHQIASTVHFLSTSNNFKFTFKHYISVLSAVKYIQPWIVMIHLTEEPVDDKNRYNQWLDDLKESIPFLTIKKLKKGFSIIKILREHGGFYVPWDNVLLVEATDATLMQNSSIEQTPSILFYSHEDIGKIGCEDINGSLDSIRQVVLKPSTICIKFQVDSANFHPKDFMSEHDWLSKHIRGIFYANKSPMVPQPQSTLIPLICHYTWLFGDDLNFPTFLSILSCLYILKAEVFIHGKKPPTGWRWKMLVDDLGKNRIRFLHIEQPLVTYGHRIDDKAHFSDVQRIPILLKYGGIYTDWDAFWVNELPENLRRYETVISYDVMQQPDFPEILQNGIMLAQPNSYFINQFQRSYRFFPGPWNVGPRYFYNSILLLYKLYECYPDRVKIETGVNVICSHQRCHPAWEKDYLIDSVHHEVDIDSGKVFAIHHTFPDIDAFENETALKTALSKTSSPSLFLKMAVKILKSANIEMNNLIH